jgi:hypothetical protein
MALDTTAQVYDHEATGWQRGLYDDIKRTFRAPFVNWIFRTTMANEPAFLRYAWGQVAPIFDTRAFAEFSVAYRDAVLTALEVPVHGGRDLGLRPPEYRELQGQLATFDIVGPRLAVLFRTLARTLDGERVGGVAGGAASTGPYPAGLDRDRGREPTMVGPDETPPGTEETLAAVREAHDLGDGLPSIYRCLAQWPAALDAGWGAVTADDGALAAAREEADRLVDDFVDRLAYTPRTTPADLRSAGLGGAVEDVAGLFGGFDAGGTDLLPMLSGYAATVGAEGRRRL